MNITIYTLDGFDGTTKIPHERKVFSGGEIHVNIPVEYHSQIVKNSKIKIKANLKNSNDIMELLMVTNALKVIDDYLDIKLIIGYLPYGRQDRVCSPGDAFSLKVFLDLIDSQGYSSIVMSDIHNPSRTEKIAKTKIHEIKKKDIFDYHKISRWCGSKEIYIVSPDSGASESVTALANKMKYEAPTPFDVQILYAKKTRDPKTGKLSDPTFEWGELSDAPMIIFDDICDYGGTFIQLADKIREKGYKNRLFLVVTHGIFAGGTDKFVEFEKILCHTYFPSTLYPKIELN